jgi:hypothetical protein
MFSISQNNIFTKQHFYKTTFLQNNIFTKQHFYKTTFLQKSGRFFIYLLTIRILYSKRFTYPTTFCTRLLYSNSSAKNAHSSDNQ